MKTASINQTNINSKNVNFKAYKFVGGETTGEAALAFKLLEKVHILPSDSFLLKHKFDDSAFAPNLWVPVGQIQFPPGVYHPVVVNRKDIFPNYKSMQERVANICFLPNEWDNCFKKMEIAKSEGQNPYKVFAATLLGYVNNAKEVSIEAVKNGYQKIQEANRALAKLVSNE